MTLLTFGVFALWPTAARPQRANPGLAPAIDASRHLLAGLLEGSGAPGFAVAVVADGRLVWSEGFGFADLEAKSLASATTLFRAGSISKSFTSVGLALLVERGRLDLDAPVRTYLPDTPVAWNRVTTRAIGGHLAGFRHYRSEAEMLRTERFPDIASGLRLFRNDPLILEPGGAFSYSSYAWTVASAVLEKASGTSFLDFMNREVFARFGMTHTRADFPESVFVGRSRFYQRARSGIVTHAPFIDNSWVWAGGGFLSSAVDVASFGAAAVLGSALSAESRAILHRPQMTRSGAPTRHGVGWFIETDARGRRMIGHDGESIGGSASLRVFPAHGLSIAMLDNLTGGPSSRLVTDAIADIFMRARPAGSSSCVPPTSVTLNRATGGAIDIKFASQSTRGVVHFVSSPVGRIAGRYSCLNHEAIRAIAMDGERGLTLLLLKSGARWHGILEWREAGGQIVRDSTR